MIRKTIFQSVMAVALASPFHTNAQISPAQNFIGVDITLPENSNYEVHFAKAKELGMSRIGLYQNWTALETAPEKYNMTILDIANSYYPAHSMAVDLTVTPIHTNNLEVPSDLTTTSFDHPLFISRFKRLLDSIKVHMPQVTFSSLVIGSEHDVYLGTNAQRWSQYSNFYSEVANYARTIWPGLKVATELTFGGLTTQNAFAQALNASSDYIGISYYPLHVDFTVKSVTTIPTDFATLISLYPNKPLCFYQYGYPSGTLCNSSEEKQAHFILQTFKSWDTYASHIRMIDFTWLHDLEATQVNYYGNYYGISNAAFLEYLRTLGLRTQQGAGTDKLAFNELQCQAKQRGYNNLSTTCIQVNGMDERETHTVKTYPIPAKGIVTLVLPFILEGSDITIYTQLGHPMMTLKSISGQPLTIETSDWPTGMYYVRAYKETKTMNGTILIER